MESTMKQQTFLLNAVTLTLFGVAVSMNPQNTAVLSETPLSYLNCSNPSSNSSLFSWSVTLLNGSTINIVAGCTTQTSTPYGTEKPTNDSCNLIIYNASPLLAGKYSCNPQFGIVSSAEFIVLDGNPVCSTSPTGDVPVGQTVQMLCGTNVYGNIKPTMTWYNGQQQVQSPQANSGNYIGSTIDVTANIPNVPSYMCNTTFGAPTIAPAPGSATNPPDYNWMCSTTSLPVLYAPVNVSISIEGNGDPTDLPCNNPLTCSANGYPSAEYTWYLPPDNSTRSGSTVSASQNGTYTCKASNTQGFDTNFITVNLLPCTTTATTRTTTTTTTQTPPSGGSPEPQTDGNSDDIGAIVGGVVGGVLGGAALLTLIICCCVRSCPIYKCMHKDKTTEKYKDRTSQGSGSRSDIVRGSAGSPGYSNEENGYSNPATSYPMTNIQDMDYPGTGLPSNHAHGDPYNDGVQYASLKVNNRPRSRQPIQVPYFDEELNAIPYTAGDYNGSYNQGGGGGGGYGQQQHVVYEGVQRAS